MFYFYRVIQHFLFFYKTLLKRDPSLKKELFVDFFFPLRIYTSKILQINTLYATTNIFTCPDMLYTVENTKLDERLNF